MTERGLAAARDPGGEGTRVFTDLFDESAAAEARQADARLRSGNPARALEGLPLSIKDLFDVAGSMPRRLPACGPQERSSSARPT